MKRKPSAATIIACVALFFSLSGAGIAASHYLISSVSQIKPSVRAALRGSAGPQGAPGRPASASPLDRSSTYTAVGDEVQLAVTPTNPTGSGGALVACRGSDVLLSGGFDSGNAVVDASQPSIASDAFWNVRASVAPGQTSGWVRAWALCAGPAN
jgi:hypothetical protein